MIKILVLAESGFGKTTSLLQNEKLGIKGLNPEETFMISCVNKWIPNYKITTFDKLKEGNRIVTSNAKIIASTIKTLKNSPFNIIILEDANYIMQDYYMKNALKTGWDCPKQIGYDMGLVFDAVEDVSQTKIIIVTAHYEDYRSDNSGNISYRMKTTGKMVSEYLTPEGKFDIVLFGKSSINEVTKKINKEFVTEHDGTFPAKSQAMFDELYIPNDMSLIIEKVRSFNNN